MEELPDKLLELDAVLAALAHEARRHILLVVWFQGGTMSAGEIAARFAHSWPTTSRHLSILEQAGLLEFEKQGRARLYRLSPSRLQIVGDWLRWFREIPPEASKTATPSPESIVRNIALAYPEAKEEVSQQERSILVRKRPFLLLRTEGDRWELKLKLAKSRQDALRQPFVQAVAYRLGKSGWVAAQFGPDDEPPIELLWEWIDESYRSVAPRRLIDAIPGPPGRSSSHPQ